MPISDQSPGDFAVRLADAIGLPLDRLLSYTLHSRAGRPTVVRATYYVPPTAGLEGKRLSRKFRVEPIDGGG